jgi:hypothetical protein
MGWSGIEGLTELKQFVECRGVTVSDRGIVDWTSVVGDWQVGKLDITIKV